MKETSFIHTNQKKWRDFENANQSNDPELLSELYTDVSEDLAYAQTFYPRRTIRVYLNQLAQSIFSGVQTQKRPSWKSFLSIWKISLPLEIYRSRKYLQIALFSFLTFVLIGMVSTHFFPDFPRVIMGDFYVDQTISNIEKGNPLAVYQMQEGHSMFVAITFNNLKVAFLTFFLGFFFTFGTYVLLFSNGVMLGAFQYFFYIKGLLITSFLGIWIHGAFEISAIVLAGGAGITAGSGWLFPGTYTRSQGLQIGVKRGLKIMLSLVPFIVMAGFLESYITRNYQLLPEWSKWTLILACFSMIFFTYVLYPIYVARKYPELVHEKLAVEPSKLNVSLFVIRNGMDVFVDLFKSFRLYFSAIFKRVAWSLPFILMLLYLQVMNHYEDLQMQYYFDWASQLSFMLGYSFQNQLDVLILFAWSWVTLYILMCVFYSMIECSDYSSYSSFWQFLRKRALGTYLFLALLFGVSFLLPWYVLVFVFFLIPFLFTQTSQMALDDQPFKTRLKKAFKFNNYGASFVVLLLLLITVFFLMQPIAFVFSQHDYQNEPIISDVLDMFAAFIQRVADEVHGEGIVYANIFRQLIYLGYLLLIFIWLGIAMTLVFFSAKEKKEAYSLKASLHLFGKRKRNQETPFDYE